MLRPQRGRGHAELRVALATAGVAIGYVEAPVLIHGRPRRSRRWPEDEMLDTKLFLCVPIGEVLKNLILVVLQTPVADS